MYNKSKKWYRFSSYAYDPYGTVISATGTMAEINPLRYRGYYYDNDTELYYLQSRYYDPEVGRFLNADAYTSTGQGILGNNMFAYCLNNPANYCDSTGTKVDIWPILFGDHVPGYIHKTVQAHIIATGLFEDELYLPGTGRADIYDPETGEIWEIKYGGSTVEMQNTRTSEAKNQIDRYINNKTNMPLQIGHAGAFTGAFVINCGNTSYCVTYDTPQPGVILYYVQQMPAYEPAASYAYYPVKEKSHAMAGLLLVPALIGIGASSLDPVLQKAYAT